MIAQLEQLPQPARWQIELRQAIVSLEELCKILELAPEQVSAGASREFSLRVPRGFVARMRKGNPHDPLLRQVLPLIDEQHITEGFLWDPVADRAAETRPGVLHKYPGRVLLVTTGACALHCRYCFRRHFPYAESNPARDQWQAALDYIEHDASISEVILSGGDPLMLTDLRLADLAQRLAAITHVRRLRVHTRMPIVLPERVEDPLIGWLGGTRLHPVMVVHANHANEIDQKVISALQYLRAAGVTVLNQSVLLRGVNDSVQVLSDLSEALFAAGVLPYYLHLLDRVQGAAHFEVAPATALHLIDSLRRTLPGYLVPRLVREAPGMPYKLSVESLSGLHPHSFE
jgi:L-lysine 2,3-aminomutase